MLKVLSSILPAALVAVISMHLTDLRAQESGARRQGDIRATKHNLTGQGDASDARQVCIFCHTPSIGDDTLAEGRPRDGDGAERFGVGGTAPAWQPSMPSGPQGFEYGIYDDIGRGTGFGSQSMACLSCHDFTQALGADIYDHPIGIPYRGATSYKALEDATESPADTLVRRARFLKEVDDFKPARKGVINQREVWWVPTSDSGVARTRQDIPLYIRDRPDARDNSIPHLECSSCHDPHSSSRLFLRVSNESSRLCLSCHEK